MSGQLGNTLSRVLADTPVDFVLNHRAAIGSDPTYNVIY